MTETATAPSEPALSRTEAAREHVALAWRPLRALGLITLLFWAAAIASFFRAPLILDAVALAAVAAVSLLLIYTSRRLDGAAQRSGLLAHVKASGSPRTDRLRTQMNAVGQLGLIASLLLVAGWTVPEIIGHGDPLARSWPLLIACNVVPAILLSTLAIVDTVDAVRSGRRLRLARAALASLAALAFVALAFGSPLVAGLGGPLADPATTTVFVAVFFVSACAGVAAPLAVLLMAPNLLATVVGCARDAALRSACEAYEASVNLDHAMIVGGSRLPPAGPERRA